MAVAVAVARAAMAVVRLSNEDESGDPITPDSQTGADADRGGAACAYNMQSESRPSGISQPGGAGPMMDEWMRRRAISKQQIAPDFGVGREGEGEDGESGQSFKSRRRERPSIIECGRGRSRPRATALHSWGAQKKSSGERQRILPAAGMRR